MGRTLKWPNHKTLLAAIVCAAHSATVKNKKELVSPSYSARSQTRLMGSAAIVELITRKGNDCDDISLAPMVHCF